MWLTAFVLSISTEPWMQLEKMQYANFFVVYSCKYCFHFELWQIRPPHVSNLRQESLTLTKPGDVLVVPRQRFFAATVQSSSARHPPESVNVCSSVEVCSPQKAHSPEALLSCKHREHIHKTACALGMLCQWCSDFTYLQVDTCKHTGSCLDLTLNGRKKIKVSENIF